MDFSVVQQHNKPDDCWVIIHGKVYDVTGFLGEHPGGPAVILQAAGGDATAAYDEVHAPSIVDHALPADAFKGLVRPETIPAPTPAAPSTSNAPDAPGSKPDLLALISVHDFEEVALRSYSPKTVAFYSSAATDLVSLNENLSIHSQLKLRPRILRNVRQIDIRRTILGHKTSAPFFVSPAAMARLAHPDGELALARACGNDDIVQIVSNNASYPIEEILAAGRPGQTFFLQTYVNSDRAQTSRLLQTAAAGGVRAVFVTVDAPIPGKREADERVSLAGTNLSSGTSGSVAKSDKRGGGLGRTMGSYIDSSLSWADIPWLRRECRGMKLVLKGVQTAADAILAFEHGVDAIMLSNHGGRSLDTAQCSILTLLELHANCPWVFGRLEIYLDGGFRRGTDILKALCLGATAVGLGRPYLYSLTYGQEGAEHMTDILKDELVSAMKLAGITSLDQAEPGMVNTAAVEHLVRRGVSGHPWIKDFWAKL